jgi:hypothetical protein
MPGAEQVVFDMAPVFESNGKVLRAAGLVP